MSLFKPKYAKGRSLARWYTSVNIHGRRLRVALFSDKGASASAAERLARLAPVVEAGELPRADDARWMSSLPATTRRRLAELGFLPAGEPNRKDLAGHLQDWKAALEAGERSPDYIRKVTNRAAAAISGARWTTLPDMQSSPGRLTDWLARQRRERPQVFGVATSNHHLDAVRAFCRWMVSDRRLPADPLAYVKKLNAQVDVRHVRRPLDPDELTMLIESTRASGRVFRRLDGMDRAMIYMVAAWTGLRASEIASLERGSFDLEANPPTVTVEASVSKHRKRDVVALHPTLAAGLGEYLARRPAKGRIWPGSWPNWAWRMMRSDLRGARARFIRAAQGHAERRRRRESDALASVDAAGRHRDFHALRSTTAAMLQRAGVGLKSAMQHLRHSDPRLTMKVYGGLRVADVARELASLPAPPIAGQPLADCEPKAPRATGMTDAGPDAITSSHVHQHVRAGVKPCPSTSPNERIDILRMTS